MSNLNASAPAFNPNAQPFVPSPVKETLNAAASEFRPSFLNPPADARSIPLLSKSRPAEPRPTEPTVSPPPVVAPVRAPVKEWTPPARLLVRPRVERPNLANTEERPSTSNPQSPAPGVSPAPPYPYGGASSGGVPIDRIRSAPDQGPPPHQTTSQYTGGAQYARKPVYHDTGASPPPAMGRQAAVHQDVQRTEFEVGPNTAAPPLPGPAKAPFQWKPPQMGRLGAKAPPAFAAEAPPPPAPVSIPPASKTAPKTFVPYTPKNPHILPGSHRSRPSPDFPLVVLIFGCRGSGKTTQAEAVAKKYGLLAVSSGNIFKEKKKPFHELGEIVTKQFRPGGLRQYNGLVLDRFIFSSETDAYYIQEALNKCRLHTPIVFWLQLDPLVGLDRAGVREETKMVLETSRFMEQQAQSVAAELAYRPAGCLHEIDCLDKSAEAVSAEIFSIIDRTYPNHVRKVLPEPSIIPRVATHFPLLDDHKTFECLCQEVHQCIGNTWRADASPLSVIGGYVDETCFTDPAKVDLMAAMHVTPKVDGNRVLVVQHKHFGFIAFPFSFAACYNVNVLFDQLEFPNPKEFITTKIPKNTSQSIDILLDAELLVTEKGPTLFIIDFLYLHGVSGKRLPFDKRYLKLIKWFDLIKKKTPKPVMEACRLILKEYTPIDLLPELLPRLEDSPYPIDGIIFQHNDGYHCGLDKKLLKWKPQEDCTVDFRLMNGVFEKNRWTFDVYTTHTSSDKKVSEEPFPGAKAVLSEQEVVQNGIRDSSVCELFLSSKELVGDKVLSTWTFFRTRTDKIRPNKDGIVQEIINMKHLKYDQLCELCSQVEYNGEL